MAYATALSPEERKRVEEIMESDALMRQDDTPASDLARSCMSTLFKNWEEGTRPENEMIVRALVVDGLVSHANRVIKADRGQVRIQRSKKVISLSSRRGVRKKDENGVPQPGWKQQTYWTMPWDELAEHFDDLGRQRANLGFKMEAVGEMLELRAKHPNTKNLMEACEIEGIDPRRFGFGVRQAA